MNVPQSMYSGFRTFHSYSLRQLFDIPWSLYVDNWLWMPLQEKVKNLNV